jgi:hypothetical protein
MIWIGRPAYGHDGPAVELSVWAAYDAAFGQSACEGRWQAEGRRVGEVGRLNLNGEEGFFQCCIWHGLAWLGTDVYFISWLSSNLDYLASIAAPTQIHTIIRIKFISVFIRHGWGEGIHKLFGEIVVHMHGSRVSTHIARKSRIKKELGSTTVLIADCESQKE